MSQLKLCSLPLVNILEFVYDRNFQCSSVSTGCSTLICSLQLYKIHIYQLQELPLNIIVYIFVVQLDNQDYCFLRLLKKFQHIVSLKIAILFIGSKHKCYVLSCTILGQYISFSLLEKSKYEISQLSNIMYYIKITVYGHLLAALPFILLKLILPMRSFDAGPIFLLNRIQ